MARRIACLLLILLAVVGPRDAGGQEATSSTSSTNPHTTPEDVQEGRMIVRGRCSSCHGLDGTGGRAPDLTRKHLRHGNSDEALFGNIKRGIPGTGMAGTNMPDRNVWRVISYLQSRRKQEPPVLAGDASIGKALFIKHNCDACHWTGKQGGRRGPNLATSRVTLEYLRRAILDPNLDVASQHRQLVLALADGRIVRGLLLNEGDYHVQLMDQQEGLHTIALADVEFFERPLHSLMQSYANALTPKELDDLIAYVYSLRETDEPVELVDEVRHDDHPK